MKTIIFTISISLFLSTPLLAQGPRSTASTTWQTSVATKGEPTSAPSNTAVTHFKFIESAIKFIDVLNNYARLIGAIASLCAVLVALYLGSWREMRRKPKLRLFFNENKSYPYFHKLSFGSFNTDIEFSGQKLNILIPGFNARIKIANKGKSTAKKVQARIEKIEFKRNNQAVAPTTYYHPTTIKWSGEPTWDPIDIVHESYFFLDLFHAINCSIDEIASFNEHELIKQKIPLDSSVLKDIINKYVKPDEDIYWNVWIDNPEFRGVPARYYFQGDVVLHIIINSKNCDPLKFEAIISWSVTNWNEPNIKIRMGSNYINNDEGN